MGICHGYALRGRAPLAKLTQHYRERVANRDLDATRLSTRLFTLTTTITDGDNSKVEELKKEWVAYKRVREELLEYHAERDKEAKRRAGDLKRLVGAQVGRGRGRGGGTPWRQ